MAMTCKQVWRHVSDFIDDDLEQEWGCERKDLQDE